MEPTTEPTLIPQTATPAAQAPPATPEIVTPPAAPTPSPFFQKAAEVGFDVSRYKDESELLGDVLSRYREQQPYVQVAQQYLAQPQPEPTPPAPEPQAEWSQEKYFQEKWQAPQYNDEWNRLLQAGLLTSDETGMIKPAQGYEVVLAKQAQALNDYQDWKRQSVNEFLFKSNPYQKMWETFQEPLERYVSERFERQWQDRFGKFQTEQFQDQFEQQHAAWLYQRDAQGQLARDPRGSFVPTPEGQRFLDTATELRKGGITDPQTILNLALKLAGPSQAAVQTQAAPPVPPVPQQPQSFINDALTKAQHTASGGAGAIQMNAPVNVNQQELDNLFVSQARAALK